MRGSIKLYNAIFFFPSKRFDAQIVSNQLSNLLSAPTNLGTSYSICNQLPSVVLRLKLPLVEYLLIFQ